MGASTLSLPDGSHLRPVWRLQPYLSLAAAHHQQYFLRPGLSHHLPDRSTALRHYSRTLGRMDLGALSICHLLAGACGMGDQLIHVSAQSRLLAHAAHSEVSSTPRLRLA